jgi:hypothetical protein
VRRLTLFAKGNVDVRDSLLYSRVSGAIQWNGINEVMRQKFPDVTIRVRHETWTRSDALLQARGIVPEELHAKKLPLGPYPAESQFSRAVFNAPRDVVVLSIQPDLMFPLYRHRRDGYLFYPEGLETWPPDEQRWFHEEFTSTGYLDVQTSMEQLAAFCTQLRASSEVPILVYNVSAVVPGEQVHCYEGLGETFSTRVRRFNLAMIELSQKLGISVVDVDTVVARAGADRVKLSPIHLTAEGHRLVAEEVTRILNDLGCFDQAF